MDVKKYMQELKDKGHSFDLCRLHTCPEWDFLPICKHTMEYQYCACEFFSEKK